VCGIEPEVVVSIRTGPYIYDYTQSWPLWQLSGRAGGSPYALVPHVPHVALYRTRVRCHVACPRS
jgi:hypothetical protein